MGYLQMAQGGEDKHLDQRTLIAMMNGQYRNEHLKHLDRCPECSTKLARLKDEQATAARATNKYA